MAPPTLLALNSPHHTPTLSRNLNFSKSSSSPQNLLQSYTRRSAATTALATIFLAREALSNANVASAFDLRMTVPDQTVAEAEIGIKTHVQDLLNIKPLVDSQSWRDAQKALRESSAYLRQDLYTIIQAKPKNLRPQLRKLYSKLFNSVTRLDYAARSKDATTVQDCYDNMVSTLNDIFAMI
ncbi:psbQ-like protein 3, chloroplastic [Magnolia sinica]|uniref:psbQ-like protein 3, chloroplastic n=1 Tax=Magnolia sinica TaxID=86752 RepID=UPI0026589D37|nr:psbQ-like protein 3, chloroplastic [Magnolia sinica]